MNIRKSYFKGLSRRQMLAGLTGVTGLSLAPFVPLLEREAEAQQGGRKLRFIYWYESVMPERDYVLSMYPRSPGALSFNGAFSPLNEVADKLLFVRDLVNRAKDNSGGGPHPTGGGTYMVGRPWRRGLGGDSAGPDGESFGPHSSLDQYLATRIQAESGTPFSDLRAGFANNPTGRGNSARSVSVLDGRLRLRHQMPKGLYSEIFPFLGTGMSDPGATAAATKLIKERRSVLDFVTAGLARLSPKVSVADRAKLDQHLTSIREVEGRLSLIEEGGDDFSRTCAELGEPDDINNERVDLAQDAYIPLLTQALACDITRVAGGHWGSHTNQLSYDFVNMPRNGSNWHQSTHRGGNERYYNAVLGLRARQFAKLVTTLDSIPDGEGTLLDSTVVLWYADIPWNHTSNDSFTMIAGGSHYFRHGQMVEASGNVNRALTSICEAMGHGLDHFGDPAYGSGTLPNTARV